MPSFGAVSRMVVKSVVGGGLGRTRTGKALRPGDFRTTSAFAAPKVCGLDYVFTVALRL